TLAYASASRATTLPTIQLATLLARLTPGDLSTVLFSSGGSEAVESALKIARQYHTLRGEPERYKVIARRGSYHGATYGAMSVSGAPQSVDPYYSPLVPGACTVSAPYCYRCDYRKTYPPARSTAWMLLRISSSTKIRARWQRSLRNRSPRRVVWWCHHR